MTLPWGGRAWPSTRLPPMATPTQPPTGPHAYSWSLLPKGFAPIAAMLAQARVPLSGLPLESRREESRSCQADAEGEEGTDDRRVDEHLEWRRAGRETEDDL